eukprot:472451_1
MFQLSFLTKNGNSILLTTASTRLFGCQAEQWRDISNFSKYLVSSSGKVKTRKSGLLLSININRCQKTNKPVQLQLTRDDGKRVNWSLSRLVLNAFKPIENSNEMFATHMNGNIYDNNLGNLTWNDRVKRSNAWGKFRGNSVRLISMTNNILEFDSILRCSKYLSSELNLSIKPGKVSEWCYDKMHIHGYQFIFVDLSKYNNEIKSFKGEKWKLFFETETGRAKHYVSCFGRVKRITNSGAERLLKYSKRYGYKVCNYKYPDTGDTIHRIVAKHWVENPNNYNSVDHIDGDPLNNLASNLRYVNGQKGQATNPIAIKRYSEAKQNKQRIQQISIEDNSVIKIWDRPITIHKEHGYFTGHILNVCRGKRRTAYGFKWNFA